MARIQRLTHENFILYAAKHYDNPQCHDEKEFYDDLRRLNYVSKLLSRYVKDGSLKERLILNHIIILNNVFGPTPTARLLFLKCEETHSQLKPFLVLLNILPQIVANINGLNIDTRKINMDEKVLECLKQI